MVGRVLVLDGVVFGGGLIIGVVLGGEHSSEGMAFLSGDIFDSACSSGVVFDGDSLAARCSSFAGDLGDIVAEDLTSDCVVDFVSCSFTCSRWGVLLSGCFSSAIPWL